MITDSSCFDTRLFTVQHIRSGSHNTPSAPHKILPALTVAEAKVTTGTAQQQYDEAPDGRWFRTGQIPLVGLGGFMAST